MKKITDRYLEEETGRSVLMEAGGLDSFTDAGQVSGWAADSLAALTASGILQGTSGTTLSPQGHHHRGAGHSPRSAGLSGVFRIVGTWEK